MDPEFKHRFMWRDNEASEYKQIGDLYSYNQDLIKVAHTVYFSNEWIKVLVNICYNNPIK